jgi:uncharacterized damage-inducible protein DinB
MTDVLECLVQIRALAETPRRTAALVSAAPPGRWRARPGPGVWAPLEVLAHLADAELFHGVRLRLVLTAERPLLAAYDQEALARRAAYLDWPIAMAQARFAARRAESLEMLSACSALDLGRVGIHARRGEITLADLVALMLAHDTAHVGQMRARLGLDAPS